VTGVPAVGGPSPSFAEQLANATSNRV